jgi:hypothetical protein
MTHTAISGAFILFAIAVMAIMVVSLATFGGFAYLVGQVFRKSQRDRNLPIEYSSARVVAKRTQVSGMDMTSTWYYVTFEFENGERREFSLPGTDYGLLAEGDEGRLGFQGALFQSFVRQAAEAPPVMRAAANT